MKISPDRLKKFIQPADGVLVVSRSGGPRTLLTDETLEEGRRRIAAGESLDVVAADLAKEEMELRK